jgi:SAM-dependent methyltransferase
MRNYFSRNGIYKKVNNYSNYVIKDGKFVGDFETMYQQCDDPWNQSSTNYILDTRKSIVKHWCQKLSTTFNIKNIVELGCGFGDMTNDLHNLGFNCLGVDISQTAVNKAKVKHSDCVFSVGSVNDFDLIKQFDADVIIMAELTWYILDDLDKFISNIKQYAKDRNRPTFLIHLLVTYDDGVQQYGKDKFTNLDEILKYFNLDYVEYGFVKGVSQGTFFVASL